MTEIDQVYQCNVCGNVVKIVAAGAGQLVCCGEPMEIVEEESEDE
jgi:superoxide reductase